MTPRPLVSWQAKVTGSPAALERPPELTKRTAVQSPTTALGWLDSDSSSDSSNSPESEADTSKSDGEEGLEEEEDDDDDESEEERHDDLHSDGFSAADVDMYFAVIAEATEDELRAILDDEGLPFLQVRPLYQ